MMAEGDNENSHGQRPFPAQVLAAQGLIISCEAFKECQALF
jgi:hypothetical protein